MFKDIPGLENYRINEDGKIYSKFTKRNIKPFITKDGYKRIELRTEGKPKKFFIHRLVLLTFVGDSDLQVNHKDGNKKNNNISNLEYCTCKYNVKHSFDKLGRIAMKGKLNSRSKIVYQKDIKGKIINKFFGTREAGRYMGVNNVLISRACKNKKLYKGFIWTFNT